MNKNPKKIKTIKVSTPNTNGRVEGNKRIVAIKASEKELLTSNTDCSEYFDAKQTQIDEDVWSNKKERVLAYIASFGNPITKGQILKHFSDLGIEELSEILTDDRVVDLRGKYSVFDNYIMDDYDKQTIEKLLDEYISGSDKVHVDAFFMHISNNQAKMLKKYGINKPYALFSLLEHLFGYEYIFERPYISKSHLNETNEGCTRETLSNSGEKELPTDNIDERFYKRFSIVELDNAIRDISIRDLQEEYIDQYRLGSIKALCDFSILKKTAPAERNSSHLEDVCFKDKCYIPLEKHECEEEYGFYKIVDSNFSVRTKNALLNARIQTLPSLGEQTPSTIAKLRNLGAKSVREVVSFFESSSKRPDVFLLDKDWLELNKEFIFSGEFDECIANNNKQVEVISEIKKAYELLGAHMVEKVIANKEYCISLTASLNAIPNQLKKREELIQAIKKLPDYRTCNHVSNYVAWFNSAYPYREIEFAREYNSICVKDMVETYELSSLSNLATMIEQLELPLVDMFISALEKTVSPKTMEIYYQRSTGLTLEEIGDSKNVTRERIRQIELKGQRVANKWFERICVIDLLYADFDGLKILERDRLGLLASPGKPREVGLFWYALRNYLKKAAASRIKGNYVILGEVDIQRLDAIIDSLPDIFERKKLDEYDHLDSSEKEYIDNRVRQLYNLKNDLYSKKNLTRGAKFDYILKNYYPSGIKIYDGSEIESFVEKVQLFFDYDYKSQRAVESGIVQVGVLCDRGKYISAGNRLPRSMANRIIKWIERQNSSTILVQSIFLQFEEELSSLGVNNKYQLQGLLKSEDLKGAAIWRDYILKKNSTESFYDSIRNYVASFDYPVSKAQLKDVFPGITDISISYALDGTSVINLFGAYINADKLNLNEDDLAYLREKLDNVLSAGQTIHIADFYELVKTDNAALLNKLGIFRSFGLFSLLQYMLPESAEYDRPFIAAPGNNIIPSRKQIGRFVQEHPMLLVEDLLWKAKALHYSVQDIRLFLEGFFDTHVLLNKGTLISIELLELYKETYLQLEEEISQGKKVFSIEAFKTEKNKSYLEDADQWLMYSLVKKWGEKLTTSITGKTFAEAVPSVLLKSSGEAIQWDGWVDLDDPESLQRLYEEMLALEMEPGNEFFEL